MKLNKYNNVKMFRFVYIGSECEYVGECVINLIGLWNNVCIIYICVSDK